MLGEILHKQLVTYKLGGSSEFRDRDHQFYDDMFLYFPVMDL